MMTVGDLIERLREFNPDFLVIVDNDDGVCFHVERAELDRGYVSIEFCGHRPHFGPDEAKP